MIKRLRWKFVIIMMTIVTVLLTLTFALLYYSAKINFYQRSMESLHSGLTENQRRGGPPAPPRKRNEMPLLVVDVSDGQTIQVVKNRLPDIEDGGVPELVTLAEQKSGSTGTLGSMHLRYLSRQQPDGTTRYVFADIYQEQTALYWQLIHSFIIGLCSLFMFFILSLYLAKWSVKPVEDAWKRQREFVADASHELKTPLTVILSNAAMLTQSPEIPEGKNRQRIGHIQAEAMRMKQLTESLLTLARGDSEQTTAGHTPLDFSFLVTSSILSFESLAFEQGKYISSEIQEGITINGDEQKLRQLIAILLDNACKYSPANATITIHLSKNSAKEALLSITNEGTPLTKEEIQHIFHRFYRADPARTHTPGYGLGLPIALGITKEHKGKIEAASDGNRQNTFSLRLPLRTFRHPIIPST